MEQKPVVRAQSIHWVGAALAGVLITWLGMRGESDPGLWSLVNYPGLIVVWTLAANVTPGHGAGPSPGTEGFLWAVFWAVNSALWGVGFYALLRRLTRVSTPTVTGVSGR